jgi:hypothetical protein
LEESFAIPTATHNIDENSIYSATARKNFSLFFYLFLSLTFILHQVDERLLDVSIPTLLDQTFPIESINDEQEEEEEDDVLQQTSISKPGDENENENDKIHQRILILEAEIEKSNKAATESLQQLSKEKLKRSDLENRIEELEFALELERKKNLLKKKKIHQHQQQQQLPVNDDNKSILDVDYCKRMLEITKKERDDALDIVREIRKLMVKT